MRKNIQIAQIEQDILREKPSRWLPVRVNKFPNIEGITVNNEVKKDDLYLLSDEELLKLLDDH